MSEPVTNVEIEDVLSSIRRLVSEENRTGHRPEAEEEAPQSDRLVLTPALRVAETSDPDAEEPVDVPETAEAERGFDMAVSDDVVAPADDTDEAPWRDPNATLFEAAQHAAEDDGEADPQDSPAPEDSEPVSEDVSGDVSSDAEDMPENSDPSAAHLAQAATSENDSEVSGGEPEQDRSSEQSVHDDDYAAEDPAGDDPADETFEDIEFLPEDEPESAENSAARAQILSAKIAALETTIAQTNDQWEPDGEIGDDYAGTRVETVAWQDHDATDHDSADQAELEQFEQEPDGPVAVDDDGGLQDVLSSEETVLDEESLRELVSDIVREELQGALGERITRNVRKLVRREIHRALTAQELE